jgi:nucleotide-binding universal stress UspA family protein
MSIKDILVHVDSTTASRARLRLALDLARAFDAHVCGLHVVPEPTVPYVAPSAVERVEHAYRNQAERAGDQSEALFQEETAASRDMAHWQGMAGNIADMLAERARLFDLLILGEFDEESAKGFSPYLLTEKVVAQSCPPALIAPNDRTGSVLGGRVAVAWDGSRAAARAIRDALPFLRKASDVHVLVADIDPAPENIRSPELIMHLARHGISAKLAHIKAKRGTAAHVLLGAVREVGADLLVMGAYGHAPLTEFLLGGATDDVLRHASVPILASH